MNNRLQIAEELLGSAIEEGGYAPCPGRDRHTKQDGKRDFRVILDGAPTGYCFHSSCSEDVEQFNKQLRRRIWMDENGSRPSPKEWNCAVTPAPRAEVKNRPPLDRGRIAEFIRGTPAIGQEWLRRRSPVDVRRESALSFLEKLYRPAERVLVFTDQKTQGDFIVQVEELPGMSRSYRLSAARGVKAAKSALPAGSSEGVWFLVQPVAGTWMINPKRFGEEEPKWTRRSECNVTSWRYFVLESDAVDAATWLRVLVNLPLPIAAVYTSGGRSIHALVQAEVPSKGEWDAARNIIRQIVCPLGADPAALSAVRLSRLPCCRRGTQRDSPLQEMIYLNPSPEHEPLRLALEVER